MRLPASVDALAERRFRLLWLGQTTSAVGDSLIPVALAFAVLELGGPRDLGIVLASYTLPRALLILAGGVWADRLPRRVVMIAADLVRVGTQTCAAVLLLAGTAEAWHLALLSAAAGASMAFFGPASTGFLPEIVPSERLQEANALVAFSRNGAEIFGPAIAGVLVATVGAGWAFALDAASFAASAAFLAAIRTDGSLAPAERGTFFADLAHGWRELAARDWLRAGLTVFAFGNTAIATSFVLGPLVAKEELGGAAAWGLIVTAGAVGATLGSLLALRFRPRRPLVWSFLVVNFTAVSVATFIPPLPTAAIAAAAVFGWGGIALANAIWDTVLQREIPRAALGRVSSYDWMVSIVFMPLGFVLAGPLAASIGTDATLGIAAAVIFTANTVVLAVPGVRRLRPRVAV